MQAKRIIWKLASIALAISLVISLGATNSTVVAQKSGPADPLQRISTAHARPTGKIDPDVTKSILNKASTVSVVVELADEPTTVVYANSLSKLGLSTDGANLESINQLHRIQLAQKTLTDKLTSPTIGATVIYSVQRVYNGVAIQVASNKIAVIASQPGVKAIHMLVPKTIDNSSSIPLIGAPQAWQTGTGLLGDNVKVGVIDTGIDYLHTDLGGPGTGYNTNDTTKLGDAVNFPGTKVVGGYDFVGDAYTGYNTPVPDPDPMDCNGHGSHVSGTIAGYGVKSDGTTYTGPYNTSTPFDTLRIGPGVAPNAKLYGLRVFGCSGSTNVVTEALDWAVDPNGDGNLSDHLDVVNMSLGAPYGKGYDPDAVASDNASLAGVVVVAASGNNGDSYFVTSSPASATRAISVAASVDALDTFDGFQVTAPASVAGVYPSSNAAAYDWATKPAVTGELLYPTANQGGCSAFPAGTFTGKIALLDWTFSSPGVNECGSVTRTSNAVNAGAIGVLMAYGASHLDIAITGSDTVPSTITTLDVGDTIKDALSGGPVTVRISKDYASSVKVIDPSQVDTMTTFSSRGPRGGDNFLKPDITAPGMSTFSVEALSGNQGISENGTSMATPHIAGTMALLRQLHPSYTVEELKALVMNTAGNDIFTEYGQTGDKYGPGRTGVGRVDVYQASQDDVVLFNAEDSGAVSVSFGAVEVSGKVTKTKTVKVENKSDSVKTFTPSFDDRLPNMGVTFSLLDMSNQPLTTVSVPANSSVQFKIQMAADASKMDHFKDVTVAATQNGDISRQWLTEAGGLVVLTPESGNPLRLPVLAVPRPVSTTHATSSSFVIQGKSNTVDVSLTGTGVNSTGTAGNPPNGYVSLVSPFELAATSPNENLGTQDPKLEKLLDAADLKYVGISTDQPAQPSVDKSEIFFGIAAQGAWSSPNEVEFDIYIDTNKDGNPEFVLLNYNVGLAAGGSDPTDDAISLLVDLKTNDAYLEDYINGIDPGFADSGLLNGSVMVIPVWASDLGLTDTNSTFDYQVVSFSGSYGSDPVDASDVLTYNVAKPAFDLTGDYTGIPLFVDMEGTASGTIASSVTKANLLLLHFHNSQQTGVGQAEVVNIIKNPVYMPIVVAK